MIDYDLQIVAFFHQFSSTNIDFILSIVINLVYVVLLYFLYYFLQKKQKGHLYLLIISGILGLGITTGLKYFINRPRPFATPVTGLLARADSSFPSRHSFLAGLGLYFLPEKFSKKIRTILQIYLSIIIPLVLLIRAEHFLSDIIVGLVIGYFLPAILNKLLGNKAFVKRSE